MNKTKKFHNPEGPAFEPGQEWIGAGGNGVEVLYTRRYGPDKWDVEVCYVDDHCTEWFKDAWNFQVRYTHIADISL